MQAALRNARGRTVGEAMHEAAIISPDTSIMSAANSIVRILFMFCTVGHRTHPRSKILSWRLECKQMNGPGFGLVPVLYLRPSCL